MAKLLLVEDNEKLVNAVRKWLAADSHVLDVALDGDQALELLANGKYDVLIMDWTIPGPSGLEVTQRFRNEGGQTPILFLTAKDTVLDKTAGFLAGADDYLTKPFDIRELSLRINALLRRPPGITSDVLRVSDLILDQRSMRVMKGGKDLYLQKLEYALLQYFMRHPGEVFSPEALIEMVWPTDAKCSLTSLRVCIKKLRDKIDTADQPSLIVNLSGRGYSLGSPALQSRSKTRDNSGAEE